MPADRLTLSPLLLLRPLSRPVPSVVQNHIMRAGIRRLHQQAPGIASRLKPIAGTTFLIVPAELPFAIQLAVQEDGTLTPRAVGASTLTDVSVRGTFHSLLAMLEGRSDGDALFFSRDLQVEGNTEALLTLRNALDSEAIRLADILLPQAVQNLLRHPASRLHHALAEDMAAVADALSYDLKRQCQTLEVGAQARQKEIQSLRERLTKQEKQLQHMMKRGLNAST